MEFGNLIKDELMTNSWMFEDVKTFKGIDKKCNETFIKERKKIHRKRSFFPKTSAKRWQFIGIQN